MPKSLDCSAAELMKMGFNDLQMICVEMHVPAVGQKADLVMRLVSAKTRRSGGETSPTSEKVKGINKYLARSL
jgi:hypothetical protein